MKKLPKLYKNDTTNFKKNNTQYYKLKNEIKPKVQNKEKINDILNNLYNIPVIIKTQKKQYETYIISKTRSHIITIDKEAIPLEEIILIKEKN